LDNVTDNTIHQNVTNVLPYLSYTYKFSNSERIRFNYSTSSSQPSLDQLQPVRDNTNPNSITEGNPNLKPDYTHSFNLGYHSFNMLKNRFIYAGGYFSYTNNAFSRAVQYLPDGRSRSKTINVDNNMYGGVYGGTGFKVFKDVLDIFPRVNANYSSMNT